MKFTMKPVTVPVNKGEKTVMRAMTPERFGKNGILEPRPDLSTLVVSARIVREVCRRERYTPGMDSMSGAKLLALVELAMGNPDPYRTAVSALDMQEGCLFGYWWAEFGMPVFNLSHGLTASLLLTDCSSLTAEELQPPFPALAMRIPYTPKPFLEVDVVRGGVPVATAPVKLIVFHAVHTPRDEEGSQRAADLMREALWLEEHGYARDARAAAARCEELYEALPKRTISVTRMFADGVAQITTMRAGWPGKGETIEAWLNAPFLVPFDGDRFSEPLTARDKASEMAAARLLANMGLYLQSDRPKERAKNRRGLIATPFGDARQGPAGFPTTWEIGREIKLGGGLQAAARAFARRDKEPREWRLTKRFTVRGHWRWQAYGPQWSLRRRAWIAPFWKGPKDIDAALVRLYDARSKR